METPQKVGVISDFPLNKIESQSTEQLSINQVVPSLNLQDASQKQKQLSVSIDNSHQHSSGHSVELGFQDSNLSPALFLLPVKTKLEHFTDFTLMQQSDNDFAPLRAYPDISTASDRFPSPAQDHTSQASECGSLSQHPLAQTTVLSEGGTSSCCDTVSWHNLSDKQEKIVPSRLFTTSGRQGDDNNGGSPKTSKTPVEPQVLFAGVKPKVEALDDDTLFLRKDVSAQHLLELLQREVGVPSSSCSAVSSTSEMSVKNTASSVTQSTHSTVCKPSQFRRECPAGEASLPHQAQQPKALSSEVFNITTGSRSTLPDNSSEELHRELLAEAEMNRSEEFQSQNQQKSSPPPLDLCFTPYPTKTSVVKKSVSQRNLTDKSSTGPFSSGVERLHREQSLWSSGNRTGIDGSYLGFLPQSQSTPGIFLNKSKSNVMAVLGKPSAIEYDKENSHQCKTGISPQDAISEPNDIEAESQNHEDSSKVQSLPSFNYIQKVDAWRTNQSSSKTSLFDSLALQGLSEISPKKKAYDTVSETLNHLLTEKVKNLQNAPGSSPANQNMTQSSSEVPSGSCCSKRTEAVGGAPSDQDNSGSAVRPTTPPFGRSQSHSSLSTVVMSAQKEREEAQVEDDDSRRTNVSTKPSAPLSLGLFSDISLDRELALSSSQDSYKSGVKLGASIGASSVTSLEVDNYAPYWTIKQSSTTPALTGPQELNIEERIPLYLHNLGIDQSPSTILTPFVPRGPIREPEFSPTDFCTIKGSIGTPTKSSQPSEGDSPHKGEFSRSSILSVGSSISIPISLDSLGPAVSNLDRRTSSSTVREAFHSDCRAAATCADSHSDILLPSQQVNSSVFSNQNVVQLDEGSDSDHSLAPLTRSEESDFESPLQMSRSLVKSASDSVVSAKTFLKFQKLLSDSQTDNEVSAGSSIASSASKEDIFLPLKTKSSRFQDSTFSSSSAAEDPTRQSSLLWARSSSDSMLMSEKPRQSSVGRESTTSSLQPYFPSTPSLTLASTAHSPLVPPKPACRAEPEGCSAAPPDNTVATQPQVGQSQLQQLPSTPAEMDAGPAEEEITAQSSSSVPQPEDMDQGGISDASSDSSLAVRVVRLLQRESPSTLMSSTPSTIDQDESKVRDWMKPKLPGQQSELQELDVEDKRRIEELKRELLLKYPTMGQLSTDTETSAPSSIPSDRSPPHTLHSSLKRQRSQPVKSTRTNQTEPDVHKLQRSESLEAQVRRIAAREGVNITRSNTGAPTSISISTCRRSASPSPSTSPAPPLSPSPEPLHPNDLSTGPLENTKGQRNNAQSEDMTTRESTTGSQKRREAVGGLDKESSPSLQCSNREDEHLRSYLPDDQFTINESLISAPNRAEEMSLSFRGTRHVSHVHVTLSPKAADQGLTTDVPSSHTTAGSRHPHREFVSPRRSPLTASSPDEDVGLTSPPEWSEIRGPHRAPGLEGAESSTVFSSAAPQGRFTSTTKPALTSQRSPDNSSGTAAVPVLLPYKPHGSKEFFYVPQLEADVSSVDKSDTTLESTHPGSDDAVPPNFSSDVLGHQDPGLDRGVTIRHTEGIYSKRLKMENYTMRESRGTVSSSTNHESWRIDEGTSGCCGPHRSPETFLPLHAELDSNSIFHYTGQSSVLQNTDVQQETHPDVVEPVLTDLDRLWQRFCDQWVIDVCQPDKTRDSSLLVRLERLSHLIDRQRRNTPERGHEADSLEQMTQERGGAPRRGDQQIPESRERRGVQKTTEGRETSKDKPSLSRPEPIEEEPGASCTSTLSHSSSRSLHLSSEGGDKSETLSNRSTSLSAFDFTRPQQRSSSHRDEQLKSSFSLSRLYSAINRQKDGREQRRGSHRVDVAASETTRADESSVVADSVSTYDRPPHPGPTKSLTAKRAVRVVSRGIQTAGDLEIVRNGTRRHTRDVGTTFPSPHESRASSQSLSSSSRGDRRGGGAGGGGRSYKHRKSKRSPSKFYPAAVSWFISAYELGSEAKKENQQRPQEVVLDERKEEEWMRRVSSAMFFPHSRSHEWREPLKQRQIHEGRNQQSTTMGRYEPHSGFRTKRTSSGLVPVSLQEALQLRRPEFIFRSTERLKCLALQAKERRLQAFLTREKEQFFYQTGGGRGTRGGGGGGGEGRAPKPAGSVQLRRAVPWKEMIQRSKLIYENLPEVQRKREEERRKAEYRTNRLNVQLYNKRITNLVLGRRAAWQ